MNDNLKRVIELANQLQEAVLECENVLYVSVGQEPNRANTGIHVYRPDTEDIQGMEFTDQDKYGNRWFCSTRYGVNVYGAVEGGGEP